MNLSFETSRLSIDLIFDSNTVPAEDITKILSKNVTKHLPVGWQDLSNPSKINKWQDDRLADGGFHAIKRRNDRTLLGFLFISGDSKSRNSDINIGYLLEEKSWSLGMASEIIEGLLGSCREKGDISTLTGGVAPQNKGSIKVLEKNGFVLSGIENETEFYSHTF